jgi:hypothetical protein
MAGRIRTVKPEWLDNQRLSHASPEARVLSIALLCMADDYGRGRFELVTTAMRVFPPSDKSPEGLMRVLETFRRAATELSEIGYFGTYQADGQDYYAIVKWAEHQKVQHPSKTNKMPEPTEGLMKFSGESLETFTGDQIPSLPDPGPCPDPDPRSEPPDRSPPRAPEQPRRRGALERSIEPATEDQEVKAVWSDYREILDLPNARLDRDRAEVIFERLRKGATREELQTVFRNALRDDWLRKKRFPVVTMLRSQDQFEALLDGERGLTVSGPSPSPEEVWPNGH